MNFLGPEQSALQMPSGAPALVVYALE